MLICDLRKFSNSGIATAKLKSSSVQNHMLLRMLNIKWLQKFSNNINERNKIFFLCLLIASPTIR